MWKKMQTANLPTRKMKVKMTAIDKPGIISHHHGQINLGCETISEARLFIY